MKSRISNKTLSHVTAENVLAWLQEAWSGLSPYPDPCRCHQLASRINTIVNRHNARSQSGRSVEASTMATEKRRKDILNARKRARALENTLRVISEDIRAELEMVELPDAETPFGEAPGGRLRSVEQLRLALDYFQENCPPMGAQDHLDPITWIACAAREAWDGISVRDVKGRKRAVRFGKKPVDPQVRFIRAVLLGIGMASGERDGFSEDTIGEHLRRRQNRARKR